MTGVSEILVLILLISGILILPRMFKPVPKAVQGKKNKPLSKNVRAGIVISVMVPMAAAISLEPWNGNFILFVSIGIMPVALAWALAWIVSAKKQ